MNIGSERWLLNFPENRVKWGPLIPIAARKRNNMEPLGRCETALKARRKKKQKML